MFDPTIFDNIKVVLEGIVYDLDLDGQIEVLKRRDLVDLASMERSFSIQFKMVGSANEQNAEIFLTASGADLVAEVLELKDHYLPGCEIIICFHSLIIDPGQSKLKEAVLSKIWVGRAIEQRITYVYKGGEIEPSSFQNKSVVSFERKIGEDNIIDLDELVKSTIHSLENINLII
ncbi:MAG: hypothetical protein AB7V16_11480 [Vulcanibacillus sp.]